MPLSFVALLLGFLLVAGPAAAFDLQTKSIHDRQEAPFSCPQLCGAYGGWSKIWRPIRNGLSYCRCNEQPKGAADEANAGLIPFDTKVAWRCVNACEGYDGWNRSWRRLEPDGYVVCGCNRPLVGPGTGRK